MGFRLRYLHLTLAHSDGRGQGGVHFERENLENGDRWNKHHYCHHTVSTITAFD